MDKDKIEIACNHTLPALSLRGDPSYPPSYHTTGQLLSIYGDIGYTRGGNISGNATRQSYSDLSGERKWSKKKSIARHESTHFAMQNVSAREGVR